MLDKVLLPGRNLAFIIEDKFVNWINWVRISFNRAWVFRMGFWICQGVSFKNRFVVWKHQDCGSWLRRKKLEIWLKHWTLNFLYMSFNWKFFSLIRWLWKADVFRRLFWEAARCFGMILLSRRNAKDSSLTWSRLWCRRLWVWLQANFFDFSWWIKKQSFSGSSFSDSSRRPLGVIQLLQRFYESDCLYCLKQITFLHCIDPFKLLLW